MVLVLVGVRRLDWSRFSTAHAWIGSTVQVGGESLNIFALTSDL